MRVHTKIDVWCAAVDAILTGKTHTHANTQTLHIRVARDRHKLYGEHVVFMSAYTHVNAISRSIRRN